MKFRFSKLRSVIRESGSSTFGDTLDDTHTFTGSVSVSSSFELNGETVLTRTNFVEEVLDISSADVTNGYVSLSYNPVDYTVVEVDASNGRKQINASNVGSSGVTADFEILSTNELHFNNNGAYWLE